MDDRGVSAALGQAIRAERARRGWTQNRLADRAGVNQAYLGRIEAGSVGALGVPSLLRLADALQVPIETLFRNAGLARNGDMAAPLAAVYDELGHPARRALLQNAHTLRELQAAFLGEEHESLSVEEELGVSEAEPQAASKIRQRLEGQRD